MTTLIIGYGNTLRSDDGAGQRAAEDVETWNNPNIRSLAVHQLTPELAADLASVEKAIFVDAIAAEQCNSQVQIQDLYPEEMGQVSGHDCHPRYLLSLAESLYGNAPPAHWILIPATNFEFGEALSPLTQKGLEIALEHIRKLA